MKFKNTGLFLVVTLLLVVSFGANAQEQQLVNKKSESIRKFDNSITLSGSLIGFNSYINLVFPLWLDYRYHIKDGFYVGASFNYTFAADYSEAGSPSIMHEDTYRLSAMAYYDLNVYKRMFLRFGAGFGVGVHRVDNNYGSRDNNISVLPYFDFQIDWVVKFSRVELSFSPLVISPSRFSIAPVKDGKYFNGVPWYLNGPTISVGVVF